MPSSVILLGNTACGVRRRGHRVLWASCARRVDDGRRQKRLAARDRQKTFLFSSIILWKMTVVADAVAVSKKSKKSKDKAVDGAVEAETGKKRRAEDGA